MKRRVKGSTAKKESIKSKRKLPSLPKRSEVKKSIGAKKGREEIERLRKELQIFKKGFEEKEVELNRLREEVRYKNQQLASKDLEMESYKKITEERIFQLEAKVKELEAQIGSPSRL